jgi:hypothetical protein
VVAKKVAKARKEAPALGRDQGRIVRRYLETLKAHKPRRGRKRTRESIAKRLEAIENSIDTPDRLTALKLTQERLDLQAELATMDTSDELRELECEFVAIAASYGDRRGISYAAWREIGIPAAVLREAGIRRASDPTQHSHG